MINERWYANHFKELSPDECIELLGSCPVGRIAYSVEGGPVVLPVNHVLDGGDILFRTSPHTELGRRMISGHVAFQVDHFDETDRTGWSVLVRGAAEYDDSDVSIPEDHPAPWADGTRNLVVRIRPRLVTGRRLLSE